MAYIQVIRDQINALKKSNDDMERYWGTVTNQAGFDFCDSQVAKNLAGKDYVCPFSSPINGALKPLLKDLYIQMNKSMIDCLEYEIKQLSEK